MGDLLMRFVRSMYSVLVVSMLFGGTPTALAQESDPPDAPPQETQTTDSRNRLINELMEEIAAIKKELLEVRGELARAKLTANETARELEELRQFIKDNREYGDDFDQYKTIRDIRNSEAKQRQAELARQRRDETRAQRQAAREVTSARQAAEQAEKAKVEQYRKAGFNPLGLDVYLGRTGFFYHLKRSIRSHVEYEPIIGDFLEPVEIAYIDFSVMTISGTVLNASNQMRNLGIAIAFFDERGNQVGAETIQINNARPNIPYPFTSSIDMALDRPFASSTSWVLYADPVATRTSDDE